VRVVLEGNMTPTRQKADPRGEERKENWGGFSFFDQRLGGRVGTHQKPRGEVPPQPVKKSIPA